jgi:uncharacterized protein
LTDGRPTPFEIFLRPAASRPAIWRTLSGCVLITLVWVVAMLIVPAVVRLAPGLLDDRPVLTLVVLYQFGAMIVGAALAVRLLQGRTFATLIGPGGFRAGRFAVAATILLVLSAAGFFAFRDSYPLGPGLPTGRWLELLPFALLGVFIQTAAEEIVFRGFLLQSLAARFRRRAIWLGLPSLLFGLLHWDPATHGPNAWLMVLSAATIGVILGDVTARHGDLSPAMGLHFANNLLALLLVAPPSQFSGLSLFTLRLDTGDVAAMRWCHLMDVGSIVAIYLVWLALRGRRLRLHSGSREPI